MQQNILCHLKHEFNFLSFFLFISFLKNENLFSRLWKKSSLLIIQFRIFLCESYKFQVSSCKYKKTVYFLILTQIYFLTNICKYTNIKQLANYISAIDFSILFWNFIFHLDYYMKECVLKRASLVSLALSVESQLNTSKIFLIRHICLYLQDIYIKH